MLAYMSMRKIILNYWFLNKTLIMESNCSKKFGGSDKRDGIQWRWIEIKKFATHAIKWHKRIIRVVIILLNSQRWTISKKRVDKLVWENGGINTLVEQNKHLYVLLNRKAKIIGLEIFIVTSTLALSCSWSLFKIRAFDVMSCN